MKYFLSVVNILVLSIVVAAVSIYFINDAKWMGYVLIALAVLCLASLLPFKIKMKSTVPDLIFGMLDNGLMAVFAVFGAHFAGVAGAVIGGVSGNAITDGIAGLFEGYSAEKLRQEYISEKRTMLKSAVGKMAGALLGAGLVLVIANWLKFW